MATSRGECTSLRHYLAHHVRHLRETYGWSQQELAIIAGVHRTYVSLIRAGAVQRQPRQPRAYRRRLRGSRGRPVVPGRIPGGFGRGGQSPTAAAPPPGSANTPGCRAGATPAPPALGARSTGARP